MRKVLNVLFVILSTVVIFTGFHGQAQEMEAYESHESSEAHFVSGARFTAIMGYSFIDNSFVSDSNDVLMVPTVGLNFDYYLSEKWGLGIHSDIILQQFKAEIHNEHEEIMRENPIGLCAVGLFKPHEKWAVLLGYGIEIEKHQNLQLIRIGSEYGVSLPKNWELAFCLDYDYKINNYGTLMFGIGFSRGLKKNKSS